MSAQWGKPNVALAGSIESSAYRGADPCTGNPSHPKNRESGNLVRGRGRSNIS
jgi:hypothetical protein